MRRKTLIFIIFTPLENRHCKTAARTKNKIAERIVKTTIVSIFLTGFIFLYFYVFTPNVSASTTFFVDPSYDYLTRSQVTATLKKTSDHAYFYLEDQYWDSSTLSKRIKVNDSIEELAQEFDQKIYPELISLFGSVWSPGIDGDSRITILISRLSEGFGGYFNTNDEYPKEDLPTSNEREMFYINAFHITSADAKTFIAHEFQHLITFYQKDKLKDASEEIWLNELRSEVVPTILGYDDEFSGSNLEKRVKAFLDQPSDSLTEWRNLSPDYGQVNLFGQYLLDHYGRDFFQETIKSEAVGIASINDALTKIGALANFSQIFTNWTIANLVNNCSVPPQNIYCYLNPNLNHGNLHITFDYEVAAGDTVSQTEYIKDWEAIWHEFIPGETISKNVLELDFSSDYPESNFKVPYVITKSNGEKLVKFLDIDYQQGRDYVSGFGIDVSGVVVIPSNQYKLSGFGSNESQTPYLLTATLLESLPKSSYIDGSLLRARGDIKVYVIKGDLKRWIRSPEIFNMYGHLKWGNIIEVDETELDYYKESSLIRAEGDEKVYQLNPNNIKHWLNMTPDQFISSGRNWNAVFIVNNRERDYYFTGEDIRC